MVPVAGQDAVFDAPALERETHMRAAIVQRENASALVYEEYWTVATVYHQPPSGFQLFEAARAYEIQARGIHSGSPEKHPRQRHSARALHECQIHLPISWVQERRRRSPFNSLLEPCFQPEPNQYQCLSEKPE